MADVKYVSRSQSFVEKASKVSVDELTQHIRETFADDLRKAKEYAEDKLDYPAVKAIGSVIENLNLKAKVKPTHVRSEKYTKKLEVVFHKNAAKDYRAFILAGLDKDGVLLSAKDDKFVYAFEPKNFERIKIKVKVLVDVTATDVSK